MFRRCRRCCYMNSCNNISNDMLETKCNNVQNCCSCSKNSCDCGFDEEDTGFQQILCMVKAMFQYNKWKMYLHLV